MRASMILFLSIAATVSLKGAELITSDGAWSSTGTVALSNGDIQANTDNNGFYGTWNGGSFNSNTATTYIDMQTATGNPQENYTAGYTYSYEARGYSALNAHESTFNVQLLGNGSLVDGTQVTGNNYTSVGGPETDSNVVKGSYEVTNVSTLLGQKIGIRINSNGQQTRFLANGDVSVSALLTNHAGFNGNGIIHSIDYTSGSAVENDYVLDMANGSTGGTQGANYFAINNTDTAQNIINWNSGTDTIRAGTIYTLSFTVSKSREDDASQTGLNILFGSASVNMETIELGLIPTETYTVEFDADALGIAGESLSYSLLADGFTGSGINQYRIGDIQLSAAIPEPSTYALLASSLVLASVMIRRKR